MSGELLIYEVAFIIRARLWIGAIFASSRHDVVNEKVRAGAVFVISRLENQFYSTIWLINVSGNKTWIHVF